jgi:hypothetical protein
VGNSDLLDTVVHKNFLLSEVIVSNILDSYHLAIVFHLLDLIITRNLSDPVDKITDLYRFQSLASELNSSGIEINWEEAETAARNFTASISSAYRLPTSRFTLSDLNKYLPGLKSLLKHKRKLRKLWQVTRNPACKTALNWVAKTIRRMAVERHSNGGKRK